MALQKDWVDDDMAQDCVTLLSMMCSPQVSPFSAELTISNAKEFSEIFLKDGEALGVLFKLIDESRDVYLRHDILSLLCGLAEACPSRLQFHVLGSVPNAVPSLVSFLEPNSNEILMADSLILLIKLSKGHTELGKTIAFQSVFESLFRIISEADLSDDDIVIQSALELLFTLVNGNPSNQLMFFEGGYIARINELLVHNKETIPSDNLSLLLKAIDSILDQWISKIVPSVQDTIFASEALMKTILTAAFDGSSAETAFAVLRDILKSNPKGQHQLMRQRHNGALFVTLIAQKALNGHSSVLDVFRALVSDDDSIKIEIASTFTPPPVEEDGEEEAIVQGTAGSLIVDAIVQGSTDSKVAACSLLLALLLDSKDVKKIAMGFGVSTEDANFEEETFSMSLLHTLMFDFVGTPKDQPILLVSFMMLFSVWFHGFPEAVNVFLSEGPVVSFLMELIQDRHAEPLDQTVCQGVASVLFGICLLECTEKTAELKAAIRTKIGREIYKGKWKELLRILYTTNLDPTFVEFMERQQAKLLEKALLPPGASASPELDAMKQSYESSISAYAGRVAELEAALYSYQAAAQQWSQVKVRLDQAETELASAKAGLEFTRLSLSSDGDGHAVGLMMAENERLRKLADSFAAQMLAVEAENEDLLRQMAELESNQHVQMANIPEQHEASAPKMNSLVEAAMSKLQPAAALVSKLQQQPHPTSHQSNTFDV